MVEKYDGVQAQRRGGLYVDAADFGECEELLRQCQDRNAIAHRENDALAVELARSRAANVYDAEAHRKAAKVEQLEAALRKWDSGCSCGCHNCCQLIVEADLGTTTETGAEPLCYCDGLPQGHTHK